MKSVIENEYCLEIKNSKFIALVYPIEKNTDIDICLKKAKAKYPNATHYCYAYILDQVKYANDDGEPNGTAGIPILLVLEKQNLNHVLCIVVRYFGKIKLGAGGLVRAYTKSTTEVLKNHILYLKSGFLIQITFSYSSLKTIDYLLREKKILKKEFQEEIVYELEILKEELESLQKFKNLKIKILKEIYLSCS